MITQSKPILTRQAGPIRTLTLNRPQQRNALNPPIIAALNAALTDAEADVGTRCLIIEGAGKSFCAGADLKYFLTLDGSPGGPTEFLRTVSATFARLEASTLPVVAAIHGHAVAGGLELALACDVVVATETALIGDGHIRNNLLPAAGSSVRLPRKVGESMARWLALTGQLVPAPTLAAAGWIHQVVPDHARRDTAEAVALELADNSGPAQSAFKALLVELSTKDDASGLGRELDIFDMHWRTSDVPSSLMAFLDRGPGTDATTASHAEGME